MGPLKAIRKFCLNCYGGSMQEVASCVSICEFSDLRFGSHPKDKERVKVLKKIKEKCIWCMGKNRQDIKNCPSSECAIFPYRDGHNPALKGICRNNGFAFGNRAKTPVQLPVKEQ